MSCDVCRVTSCWSIVWCVNIGFLKFMSLRRRFPFTPLAHNVHYSKLRNNVNYSTNLNNVHYLCESHVVVLWRHFSIRHPKSSTEEGQWAERVVGLGLFENGTPVQMWQAGYPHTPNLCPSEFTKALGTARHPLLIPEDCFGVMWDVSSSRT